MHLTHLLDELRDTLLHIFGTKFELRRNLAGSFKKCHLAGSGSTRLNDEELVAVIRTDGCAPDAGRRRMFSRRLPPLVGKRDLPGSRMREQELKKNRKHQEYERGEMV